MKTILLLTIITLMPFLIIAQHYEEIKVSALPKKVNTYVTAQMPEGTIVKAAKALNDGKTVYAAIVDFRGAKRIMIFDENGQFIKRVESLKEATDNQDARSKGPDPTNTSNTVPHPEFTPTAILQENQIPSMIVTYLKTNLTTYTVLQAKQIAMGEATLYQLIVRDKTNDYVYFFDSKGDFSKKRSYLHKNSPFRHQFPLKGASSNTSAPASEKK